MGTAFASQTAISPGSQASGDKIPVERAGGVKRHIDLSAFLPPGIVMTQNAANSAEFKSIVLANDAGFDATGGGTYAGATVEATNFRVSIGSFNTTDVAGQNYSNSAISIGFNNKAVHASDDQRHTAGKHSLAIVMEANRKTALGMSSDFSVRFQNRDGSAHFEALRFVFGNADSGTGAHTAGEFLQDARIGVSGIRGKRGCDFLGWTKGGSMGWASGNFNADVFVASIRQNELLFYYDNDTNYPFINMRLRQMSRYQVHMDLGMEAANDPSNNAYNTTPQVPQAFIRFGSRPYEATWPNASYMHLGMARDTDAKDAITAMSGGGGTVPCILGVYTGNAQPGTKGLILRGGKRNDTIGANNANLLEIQSTADGGATGTVQWSWGVDGLARVAATQVLTSGATYTAVKANWDAYADPTGFLQISQAGTTRYIPLLSA